MITVFTPTYNRSYALPRLFESLQQQTSHDFEWVVVDDGSTDDTLELLEEFVQKAAFPMRYEHQSNAGKHVAINRGARLALGEWFFIVDSDDWLPDDSIETNLSYIAQIQGDPGFAGVSGVCARADGSLLVGNGKGLESVDQKTKSRFELEYIDATSQSYRFKYKMPGDRAEIVRTELVRRFPFPVFEGERFMAEYYLWQSISELGLKLRWFNKPTYFGDYLQDGLTNNMRTIMLKNPEGRSFVDNFTLATHAPIKSKLNSAVNYLRYGLLADHGLGELISRANNKLLVLFAVPVALLLPLKRQ